MVVIRFGTIYLEPVIMMTDISCIRWGRGQLFIGHSYGDYGNRKAHFNYVRGGESVEIAFLRRNRHSDVSEFGLHTTVDHNSTTF